MGLAPDIVGERRTCHSCAHSLPIDAFQETPGGRRRKCRDCRNFEGRIRAEKKRGSLKYQGKLKDFREQSVYRRVGSVYGLSKRELAEMRASQRDLCAICGKPESRTRDGVPLRLCIDHNSQTGQVRGLLCSRCNVAIGMLDHDIDVILAAAQYLKKYEEEGD